MTETETKVLQGRKLTSEDEFYLQWGRESIKSNIALMNDVLKQLRTLITALLGGSVAFLNSSMMDPSNKSAVVAWFFIALIVSFFSLLPYRGTVSLNSPTEIRQHKDNALEYKQRLAFVTSILMLIGFLVALVGLMSHGP